MSATEQIILCDLLYSKIPGSSKRKSVLLYVELTPTQLHIFEVVTTRDAASSSSQPSQSGDAGNFTKGEQIRSLWRYHEEANLMQSVKKIAQPGRRSRMHKFYIQKPDGLYKFKIKEQERRDKWVEELLTSASYVDGDNNAAQGTLIMTDVADGGINYPQLPPTSVPTIEYTHESIYPYHSAPSSLRIGVDIVPWLEPIKTGDGRKHSSLTRQMSSDSDFPRSPSASFYSDRGGTSESGYSSGDFNHDSKSPSRSASCEDMPVWEHSPPLSPTDASCTAKKSHVHLQLPQPKTGGVSREAEQLNDDDDDKLQLSKLGKLTQDMGFNIITDSKCLSPVPEESEAELNIEQDLEVVYLLKDALEYTVTREGKVINLLEDLGIIIDVPPGAIPDDQPNEITVKINACIKGSFQLPEGHELASPVFHIEPGAKFAEKPVELSIVHFLDVEDEEACAELKFVSAPFDESNSDIVKEMIKFKNLDGGTFLPGGRFGKIALQHFCFIAIAKGKKSAQKCEEGELKTGESLINWRTLPSKKRYIALLYFPLSFPVQPPRRYYVIFSISLDHPMYIKNLDKQLGERFSAADSKLWRTSREVNYAEDVIELDIPHEILQEVGYEVHTDLGCVISKENVDSIRRSRLSKSDYANYIDYPPRILMTVQQTLVTQQPSKASSSSHPQLKLKGTLPESCFNLPLPVPDTSTPSVLPPSKSIESHLQLSTSGDYSLSRADAQTLVSPQKQRSLYSVPDLRDLGEKVTPHVHPKWYHIGIQMGLQPATLEGIELKHPADVQRRCGEVFKEWICRSEQNPTWMTLIEILRGESVGERKLANELEILFE